MDDRERKIRELADYETGRFCDNEHDSPNEPVAYTERLRGEFVEAIEQALSAVYTRFEQDDPLVDYQHEEAEDRRVAAEWESKRLERKNLAA